MCMSEMPRGVHFGECKGKRRNWTRAGRTPRPCNRGLWVGSEKLEPTSAKGWMQFSPRRARTWRRMAMETGRPLRRLRGESL